MVKQCQAHVEVQVNEVPQQVHLNDIMYIYIYYRFIQSIVPARPHPTVCLAQHQVRQVEVPPKKAWNRPGIKWSIVVPLEQKCMWSGAIGPTMSRSHHVPSHSAPYHVQNRPSKGPVSIACQNQWYTVYRLPSST